MTSFFASFFATGRLILILAGVMAVTAELSAQTQTPPQMTEKPATGVIVGTVVDAGSGKPIAGASVSTLAMGVADATGNRVTALTGSDGRFLFRALAEGSYTIVAQRGGYIAGSYGAIAPQRGGVPVDLATGQTRTDIVVQLWKPAAISGHVTDETGDPLVGIVVQAWMRRPGRSTSSWQQLKSVRTDDRGMYRLSSLMPDSYLVFIEQTHASLPTEVLEEADREASKPRTPGVTPPLMAEIIGSRSSSSSPGQATARTVGDHVEAIGNTSALPMTDPTQRAAYVSQFYPGASAPSSATPVVVASGEERSGVDMQLRPVKSAQLSGTLMGPNGPLAYTRLTVVPTSAPSGDVVEAGTVTDSRGRFTLLRVPEGAHVIQASSVPAVVTNNAVTTIVQNADGSSSASTTFNNSAVLPPLPPDPALYAQMPITTGDKDIADVVVTARAGARIKGRIEIPNGATAKPEELQRISVNVTRTDDGQRVQFGSGPRVRVDGTGEVTSQGFSPGEYTINVFGVPKNWFLVSVMHGGHDVSQMPFALTNDVDDLVFSFTTTPNQLAGVVRDNKGTAVSGALVMIFPADTPLTDESVKNARRVTRPVASSTGKYSASNLPAGDYFVAAIAPDDPENTSAPSGGLLTVDSLTLLRARATRVTIGNNEHRALDLVIKGR